MVPDNQKRRGKKRVKDERYFRLAKARIDGIRARLATAKQDGLNAQQRSALRN